MLEPAVIDQIRRRRMPLIGDGGGCWSFLHVEDAALAAVAAIDRGVACDIFNIVDDDLLSSREFLRQYKRKVKNFRSFYVPHAVSYGLCYAWEKYAQWSQGQLPESRCSS